ncbi:MAG: hypothetical protein C4337_00260 [Armatimonadota bacterium]
MHWKISLHGGHSQEFCEHAESPLRAMLDAAVQAGYGVFGVTEHMPRLKPEYLYAGEIEKGWSVETLKERFDAYARTIRTLAQEYEGRLTVLCGFETEVVPPASYAQWVAHYRQQYGFDYCVGSVHHLDGVDMSSESLPAFRQVVEGYGGMAETAIAYYRKVAEMVQQVRPEVVAHLDLIRLAAHRIGRETEVATPAVQQAAEETLSVIREVGSFVEINTAGWRKGLRTPYPDQWVVQLGARMGILFCIGDDSHSTRQVGFGLEQARAYLLQNGVRTVHFLNRRDGVIVRESAPLE